MARTTARFSVLVLSALLIPAAFWPATALTICLTDGNVTCFGLTPDQAQIARDARMIDTGQHRASGSYLNVDEIKRTKDVWPLGKPSLQNCRFCLEPDRLNAARLKSLP